MQFPEFPTQRRIVHWTPFAFCSFLSLMALFGSVVDRNAGWSGYWAPAFFSFLPMCFFYMGAVTMGMQREINDLKEQIKTVSFEKADVTHE